MAVYVSLRLTRVAVRQASFRRLAERVLAAVGEAQSELSIDLVGDGRMRRLNREYRKKDRTTDVLAFAMRESAGPVSALLGDVVISIPTAQRQAKEGGRSLSEELAWLLVHGVLHLCGYDHERSDMDARRMKRREQAILKTLRPVPTLAVMPRASGIRARSMKTGRR
ncbi:MAG: rRNA maturation RNase YbeY [Nitrospira sp.]|nr:rRNA maturation RNase YbeY [Nitrospira sp.]